MSTTTIQTRRPADPDASTLLPLGPNNVTCSVTDSGGLTTSASFTLTVVDTTPPALLSVLG